MATRREAVEIHVRSNLAAIAARDAAAMKGLANTVDSVSTSAVQSDRTSKRMSDSLGGIAPAADKADRSTKRTRASIDQLTGRLRLAADVAAILGPALAPIGAVSAVGVAGLASQLGFAAAAGGTAIIAFQGVGDAVTALNKAALEPTNENLLAAEGELARLSPAAQDFARQISSLRDEWQGLRAAAASGLFPELTESLSEADVVFDRAERVLESIGSATGAMLADGIDSLGTDRWAEFTSFLEREAKPVMADLGSITGSFTHGLAELWMATQPLNRDMSSWLVDSAAGFDAWAQGLDQTEGFANFVDYVRDNGPAVAQTASAIGSALVDIAVAAAPLGGPSLKILEAIASVFSAIADSPIGTPLLTAAAGLAALNRGLAVGNKVAAFDLKTTALGKTLASTRTGAAGLADDLGAVGITSRQSATDVDKARTRLGGYASMAGKASLAAGGLALATTDLGGGLLSSSTASGALMGSIAGIPGVIIGGAIGAVLDLRAANADLEQSMNDLSAAAARQDFAGETDAYSRAAALLAEQGKLHDDFFGGFGDQTRQLLSGDLLAGAKAGLGDLIGYGVSDARDDLAAYNREMQALGNPDGLGDALGQPFDTASRSITGATSNVLDFIDATSRLEGVLAEQGALVNYKAAMDDLDASLAENGNTFNVNTEAGRANTQQLLSAGQAAIDYAKNLKGADRTRFLENARQDLRSVADEFPKAGRLIADINRELRRASGQSFDIKVDSSGLKIAEGQARRLRTVYDGMPEELQTRIETSGIPKSQQEVRILAKAYDLTPREVRTLMTLQAAAAKTGIRDVQSLLTATGRMRPTPTVNANTGQASGALGALISQLQTADGYHATSTTTHTITTIRREVRVGVGIGAATGLPRAYGGPVVGPGTERSDNILTPTSPGEWVLQAPAVRKYGEDFISQLNDMAIPTTPALPGMQSAREIAAMRAESREQMRNFSSGPGVTAAFNSMNQDRYAYERQGMLAAQRSGGGMRERVVVVQQGGVVRGTLNTPWGPADVELIAESAATRVVSQTLFDRDEMAGSEAGRVTG